MAKRTRSRNKTGSRSKIKTWPLYIVLALVFVLYFLYQGVPGLSGILGISLFAVIILIIGLEFAVGVKEEGTKKNLIEIAIAVVIVVALWFSLQAALKTSTPLDVVPSCSMLPSLQRGDLVVLQGVNSVTQLHAPVINVTSSTYNAMIRNIGSEELSCVAYSQSNGQLLISPNGYMLPGYTVGLYKSSYTGGYIVQQQPGSLIQYQCGVETVKFSNGTAGKEAALTSLTIANTTIAGDKNNTVVVYKTVPNDLFYQIGDAYIVHRIYAIINASGSHYALTKGDNNPGLDLQYSNYPASLADIQGKVVASIPYLGYLKLILSGSFSEPSQCSGTLQSG
ncbi:MAG: hypothetical protein KGH60_04260 [Candidatus Micrarchaeota archaeon]|nr:hypothetical protein [Candidatus Micrarchaeota archaeon]